jgi:ADP-ribosylglycohydrolase
LKPQLTLGDRRVRIAETVYRDKVLGCWLGKNAGGTLGGPLEQKFGQEEMFDVSWYPELPEGGIPNDDLELQLIWLQALRERGPGIVARDLAEYWLDCIRYNFDEYGLSKTNLQKGLVPPVSGWHNNWFKHCMGSPIRSEIWACVAPGTPEIAAAYAFEDARILCFCH